MDRKRRLELELRLRELEESKTSDSPTPESMADFAKLDESRSISNYIKDTASNVPSSTFDLVADTASALMSPVETAKVLKDIVLGIGSKTGIIDSRDESKADALIEHYSKRYGGAQNLLDTIRSDPAGFAADLSVVASSGFGAASAATKTKGALAASGAAPTISKYLKNASNSSLSLDPINALTNTGAKAVQSAAGKISPWLMQGVIKPSSKMDFPTYNKAVATAIEDRYIPTQKSSLSLNDEISQLGGLADDIAKQADGTGVLIDPKQITSKLADQRDQLGSYKGLDQVANSRAIDLVEDKYLRSGDFSKFDKKSMLKPSDVQRLKKNIYSDIKFDSKNLRGTSEATVAAQKSLGKSAKEIMEQVTENMGIPIKPLNERISALSELSPLLDAAVKRREGTGMLGLSPLIGGNVGYMAGNALGGATGGAVGGALGIGVGILDKALPKSIASIFINELGNSNAVKKLMHNNIGQVTLREVVRASELDEMGQQ